MKFKKSIYKAEKLLDSYQHDPDITLLNAFKKASNDIGSKGYLLNIKYLYVYQMLKASETLPDRYVSLAKTKLKRLESYFNSSFQKFHEFLFHTTFFVFLLLKLNDEFLLKNVLH